MMTDADLSEAVGRELVGRVAGKARKYGREAMAGATRVGRRIGPKARKAGRSLRSLVRKRYRQIAQSRGSKAARRWARKKALTKVVGAGAVGAGVGVGAGVAGRRRREEAEEFLSRRDRRALEEAILAEIFGA